MVGYLVKRLLITQLFQRLIAFDQISAQSACNAAFGPYGQDRQLAFKIS